MSASDPPSISAIISANPSTDGLPNREYAYPLRAPEKIASASSEVPRLKMVLCTMGRWNGAFVTPGLRRLAPPCAHRVASRSLSVLIATTSYKASCRSRSPRHAMIEHPRGRWLMCRVSCLSSYDTLVIEASASHDQQEFINAPSLLE